MSSDGDSASEGDESDVDELSTLTQSKSTPLGVQTRPQIRLPEVSNVDEYIQFDTERVVERVLHIIPEFEGDIAYEVEYESGHQDVLSYDQLIALSGGQAALDSAENINQEQDSDAEKGESPSLDEEDTSPRPQTRTRRAGKDSFMQPLELPSSDDELVDSISNDRRGRPKRAARSRPVEKYRSSPDVPARAGRVSRGGVRGRRANGEMPRRSSRQTQESSTYREIIESSSDDSVDVFESDLVPKRKRMRFSDDADRNGLRTSGRSTKNQRNMEEASMEDVYRSNSDRPRPAPKPSSTKENFQSIPQSDSFAQKHVQQCDTCERPAGPSGPLIYCQGCPLAYHKQCIGARNSRDHLVTKISEDNFVLQCRRCINFHRKKDPLAPDHGICQTCRDPGPASAPFRPRVSAAQEAQQREENDGVDPPTNVNPALVNNADNVLFRCHACTRAYHFHHLPTKTDAMDVIGDDQTIGEERFREYAATWECKECSQQLTKVSALVAWRPTDLEDYVEGTDTTEVAEDEKEYLVKWEKRSYFQAQWAPGAWVWGVTSPSMRKAFAKRNNDRNLPIMSTEEAIPEDYLRIDIVLDVKFTSYVETRAEEIDKARIREVDQALMKYKGLGYEDAVWEQVPGPDDGDRWMDFVRAYDDWVVGRYVKLPKSGPLKIRIDKARAINFNDLEKKEQPKNVSGGKLMNYQLEGLNWLYFRWHQQQNGILADEMGLGKTIQIIGMLATLTEEHNCFPFLLVVPNSTCPNWRREIKQWAPSLRVVTYFGSSQARRMAYEHELFPEGSKTIKCHVVVTSYEAAADDSARRFLKSVPWQGLIVDEGQRLKSDKTNLYGILSGLKIPFSILLTGTPLQNNARELFNLLQFLDPDFDAAALEVEYSELTKDNIPQLHDMIRPFFLRRTKAQVLTFLPPLAQVILPVSMSLVQRKLYKTILSKNPDLLRAIFHNNGNVGKAERGNLNNMLIQLRKCLSHPFIYSEDIEERNVSHQTSHRNLVDASSKLQLLEVLLPKLKAKGHRVLIFSQLLNMLTIVEDFMTGMDLEYQRLDGTMSAMQKQKRIDKFNAPDSTLFAFLLSTRAGGVGINLASADTVIILDPDWNPHQDIQAISRAHRIGQTKKVLCFQLMTSSSVEEKIMQIGRSKMALDHVLIERMDDSDETIVDVESILKHGAAAILEGSEDEVHQYDDASIDKLLDRSQIEDTQKDENMTAESQFSFARVWANEAASLVDNLTTNEQVERAPDPSVWDRILQERERAAAEEASRRHETFGRGRRTKQAVDYGVDRRLDTSPHARGKNSGSDTDFQEGRSDDEDDDADAASQGDQADLAQEAREVALGLEDHGYLQHIADSSSSRPTFSLSDRPPKKPLDVQRRPTKPWRRSNVTWPIDPTELPNFAPDRDRHSPPPMTQACVACGSPHRIGYCPLKLADVEHCNLCGLAHYGKARTCPHIRSETQVRLMLQTLRESKEPPELVNSALHYLQGVKGNLAQHKRKIAQQKLHGQPKALPAPNLPPSSSTPAFDTSNNPKLPLPGSFSGPGAAVSRQSAPDFRHMQPNTSTNVDGR